MLSDIVLIDNNGLRVAEGRSGECVGKSPWQMLGICGKNGQIIRGEIIRSGDLLKRDKNGYYYFTGRIKNIIRSGGENVCAEEVENIILRHPGVSECAVFGVAHNKFSEIIVAAVKLSEGAIVSESELIDYCKKNMTSFKKPKKIIFLDELPKTNIGKNDTKILRKKYESIGETIF